MTHKQRKALARRKAIAKARNIRQNNMPKGSSFGNIFAPRRHTYRFWDL